MQATLKAKDYLNGYDQECVQFYLEVVHQGKSHTINVSSAPKSYYRKAINAQWTEAHEKVWYALNWMQSWIARQGMDYMKIFEAYQKSK